MKTIRYLLPIAAILVVGCSTPVTYEPVQDPIPVVVITRPTQYSPYLTLSAEYRTGNGRPAILLARYQGQTTTCRYPTTPGVCKISLSDFGIREGTPDGFVDIEISYGAGSDTALTLSRLKIQNDEFMVPQFRVRLEKAAVYSVPSVTKPTGEVETRNAELYRFAIEQNGYVFVCSSKQTRSWVRLTAGEKTMRVRDGFRTPPC